MIHPYASQAYARSLTHWGEPLAVPEWGGFVLLRDIPAGGRDAYGTYPVAVLTETADLAGGLARLRRLGLVAVTLVLDDFHRPALDKLCEHFSVVRAFKTHYLHRTASPPHYGKHHRYEIGRALRKVVVAPLDLAGDLAGWTGLYRTLVARHGMRGVHDFPLDHHRMLQSLAGVTAIGAWLADELVSAHVWVSDGRYVHSHLAASSDAGYKAGAAYAVYDASLRAFPAAELLNLGGGAGIGDDPDDGLARFKRGFANDSARSYICGEILDRTRYEALSQYGGTGGEAIFFPAYRRPQVQP